VPFLNSKSLIVCALLSFCLITEAAHVDDFNLHLPSSWSATVSSSSDDTRTFGGDVNFSLENNTQLSVGYTKSNLELNGETFSFHEERLGVGTDPLNDLSSNAQITALANGNDTQQYTGNLEFMWSPENWIFTITPGYGSISTANRPNIFQQASSITLHESSIDLAAEYFLKGGLSFRAFGGSYSYDNDLSYINKAAQFSQTYSVDVIPASSQQLLTGLPEYLYGLGINYAKPKWSLGLQLMQAKTKLDDDTNLSLKLSGSYKFAKTWSMTFALGQLPSFEGDASASTRSARIGVVHTW
jgi:hypothetical protein